jgi:hypothetical protein
VALQQAAEAGGLLAQQRGGAHQRVAMGGRRDGGGPAAGERPSTGRDRQVVVQEDAEQWPGRAMEIRRHQDALPRSSDGETPGSPGGAARRALAGGRSPADQLDRRTATS